MSVYTDSVQICTGGLQSVNPGMAACCPECNPDDLEQDALAEQDKPSFSWRGCDTCGSSLGGDSSAGHGFLVDKDPTNDAALVHLRMCTDCVLYFANGDEPDTWQAYAGDDDHPADD